MPTITLPMVGTIERKWVWVGAGTVAALVGWSYWRKRSNAPTTVVEGVDGTPDTFVPDGGQGNVPGQTGNASGSWDNSVIDTVPEWTADVVAKLGLANWDSGYIYATIGKWIAGDTLTDPERSLVQAAVAAAGQPPGGPYPIRAALPTPAPTPTPAPYVNPYINPDGTLSIGAGANLTDAAASVGLTLAQLAALNPSKYPSNGTVTATRGMPYRIK